MEVKLRVLPPEPATSAGRGSRSSPRHPRRPRRSPGVLPALLGLLVTAVACAAVSSSRAGSTPPVAPKIPHRLEAHGQVRIDDYYWLRERDNPRVRAYLAAENAYREEVLADTRALQETLFEEIKGRIKQDDATVPYLDNGFYLYSRYEEGQEYAIHCRRQGTLTAPEEILLDENVLAAGHDYFDIWRRALSPDGRFYAFAVDTVGRRIFTIRIKDVGADAYLPDEISGVTSNFVWANDSRTLFYAKQDSVTLRYDRIFKHRLGTDPGEDPLAYRENDETFDCFVGKSKSDAYLFIISQQTVSTEYRFLDASDPDGAFRVLEPRTRDHEYAVDHLGDTFYIRTNWNAENFRLMATPVSQTARRHWQEIVPHRADVYLEEFDVLRDALVLSERHEGLIRLRMRSWDGDDDHYIDFGEPTYLAYLDDNHEIDLPYVRYRFTSLKTPWSVYDYEIDTRTRTLRKRDEVLGDFDPQDYRTERMHAPARDGERVPLSLVYPRDLERDGRSPLLLYGYGAYGYSSDAVFSAARLSLLERGFAYAIAHVRGGQELGRRWYEEGRLLNKMNTFTDFIDCAEHLIAEGYTSSDRIYAYGSSAGGLLVGAVINMQPDLFDGAIADVPWVDVVTTMMDASIPLTTSEYDEWGNPADRKYYDYMLSYSPYDNVRAIEYPHLLVTTGLHDSQVQYWEPAKWVAKLRALKTGDNLLLLRTKMESGHWGTTGRFAPYRDIAEEYAFLLHVAPEDR